MCVMPEKRFIDSHTYIKSEIVSELSLCPDVIFIIKQQDQFHLLSND